MWDQNDDDEDPLPADPGCEVLDVNINGSSNISLNDVNVNGSGGDDHGPVSMDSIVSEESAHDSDAHSAGPDAARAAEDNDGVAAADGDSDGGGGDGGASTLPLGVANDLASLEALVGPKRAESSQVQSFKAASGPSTPLRSRVVSVAGGGANAVKLLRAKGLHASDVVV